MKPLERQKSASFSWGIKLSAFIAFLSILGFFWTPYDPSAMSMQERLTLPNGMHWFGTDPFGRDIFSIMLAGMKNSLFIACCAVALGALAGTMAGFFAALSKSSLLQKVLGRLTDFMFIFPALLTAILLATLYGPSIFNAIAAIAIFNIPVFFRMSRNVCAMLLLQDYTRAAIALGQTSFGLLYRHLLPGSASILLTQVSIQLAMALLAEASLSYLGLGVPSPQPSLGRMLEEAQTYITIAPQLAVIPGSMIALAVLAFNLLGDGLRDKIDPRRRQFFC
jgi:peptide/nickel transport system permease protein